MVSALCQTFVKDTTDEIPVKHPSENVPIDHPLVGAKESGKCILGVFIGFKLCTCGFGLDVQIISDAAKGASQRQQAQFTRSNVLFPAVASIIQHTPMLIKPTIRPYTIQIEIFPYDYFMVYAAIRVLHHGFVLDAKALVEPYLGNVEDVGTGFPVLPLAENAKGPKSYSVTALCFGR